MQSMSSSKDIESIRSSPTYYNYIRPPPNKKYIGTYIQTIQNIQPILDQYYTKCMDTKLISYDKKILIFMNKCLTSNIELFNLFNIIVNPRTFTNRFRKNNTLNNLIQLYNMIRDMLVNYDIQNTFDLTNYSCFHMLVNVSIVIKSQNHLPKYFESNGNLIDLLLEIRKNILMIAFAFLNRIKLSYDAIYSVMVRNLNNISHSQNFKSTTSLLSTNPISSPILNVSQKNYDIGIDLYIQFLSMYNQIIYFIKTFEKYSTSTGNSTPIFIDEINKMFNDISTKNKLLFKEYIKHLGKVEIKNSVITGFGFVQNVNSLMKGLYYKGQVY